MTNQSMNTEIIVLLVLILKMILLILNQVPADFKEEGKKIITLLKIILFL